MGEVELSTLVLPAGAAWFVLRVLPGRGSQAVVARRRRLQRTAAIGRAAGSDGPDAAGDGCGQ